MARRASAIQTRTRARLSASAPVPARINTRVPGQDDRPAFFPGIAGIEQNAIDSNRVGDVLEPLLSETCQTHVRFVYNMIEGGAGDAIPPGSASPSRRAATSTPSP